MDAMPDSDLQTREALLAKAVHAWVDDSELDSAVLGPPVAVAADPSALANPEVLESFAPGSRL